MYNYQLIFEYERLRQINFLNFKPIIFNQFYFDQLLECSTIKRVKHTYVGFKCLIEELSTVKMKHVYKNNVFNKKNRKIK